jgi:hypothetical protein
MIGVLTNRQASKGYATGYLIPAGIRAAATTLPA